jgi:hypothetical protein
MIMLILWCSGLPVARAIPQSSEFPDVTFRAFSQFIDNTFHPNISLATVLVLLFSLTENPELLNLHARQQHPQFDDENKITASGWIKALAHALLHRLKNKEKKLFKKHEYSDDPNLQIVELANKLHDFALLLELTPYDENETYKGKLLPVSEDAIKPVHLICPITTICMDSECEKRGLLQGSKIDDITSVRLIKGNNVYQDAFVLSGKCSKCN